MHFEPGNFFSNFNMDNKTKNYSDQEVIFVLEIKVRYKGESLVDEVKASILPEVLSQFPKCQEL